MRWDGNQIQMLSPKHHNLPLKMVENGGEKHPFFLSPNRDENTTMG